MTESDTPRPHLTTSPEVTAERLATLPTLPRNEDGPVFAEPWQAQAFALAVKLSEQGHFSWKTWARTLADELARAEGRGEPDDGSQYYRHWVSALERLVVARGLSEQSALAERKAAWADAYLHTPHGQPVELPMHFSQAGRPTPGAPGAIRQAASRPQTA